MQAAEKDAGLSLSWAAVLAELDTTRGMTVTELSDRVDLSAARVSRLVDDLINHRLASKVQGAEDKRTAVVTITSEGRQRMNNAAPIFRRAVETALGTLTGPQRRALTTLLEMALGSSARDQRS